MRNVKLIIAYDGRNYLGWQKTNTGPSIEETLQNTLEKIIQQTVSLQAASRTDAGVHAKEQVVNFLIPKLNIDVNLLCHNLNCLLPKDIIILKASFESIEFHPTLSCIAKEYHYFISYGKTQLPYQRFYAWHVTYPLHLSLIHQALPLLIGVHDFSAFCNLKKIAQYSDYVREIYSLELIEVDSQTAYFSIKGNHFLYKMVRNIVGTLVDIGRKKIPLDSLPSILQSKSRPQAGITAPAHGLFLQKIFYKN